MNIESLELFRQVVEAKSISKVAQRTHFSQSALSQMVNRIEDRLNKKLLIRSNSGVRPTEMGEIVLKYTENIIRNYDRMLEDLDQLERRLDTVRINATWSLVNYSIPCALYRIKKRFPNHRYELMSSSNEKTLRDVSNDICDIGFVSELVEDKQFFTHKIGYEKLVLCASQQSAVEDKISLEDLKNHEFVTLKDIDSVNSCLNTELIEGGISFDDMNIIFAVDSISAVKSSIENNYGISFLPYTAVKREIHEGRYRVIEVAGLNMEYNIYMLSKPIASLGKSVRETVEAFIDIGKDGFC